jgi:hypothetical protein
MTNICLVYWTSHFVIFAIFGSADFGPTFTKKASILKYDDDRYRSLACKLLLFTSTLVTSTNLISSPQTPERWSNSQWVLC